MTGRVEEGVALAADSSADAEALGLYPLAAEALSVMAISHAVRGDFVEERRTHLRRLDLTKRHGDLARTADALNILAEIALDEDDLDTAASYAEESLALVRGVLPIETRDATISLARVAALADRPGEAATRLTEALAQADRVGQTLAVGQCLRVGACLAVTAQQHRLAVRLFAAAQSVSPSPSGSDQPVEADFARAWSFAREAVGTDRAASEWTLGLALPLESMLGQLDEAIGLWRTETGGAADPEIQTPQALVEPPDAG